jgi:hypothetical protein
MDTDSIIYHRNRLAQPHPTGEFLGEWESELKPGDFITHFISLGPKCYSYRVSNGEEVTHLKGWRHTLELDDMFSFEYLRGVMFEGDTEAPLTRNITRFQSQLGVGVNTLVQTKKFQMVFSKRCIIEPVVYNRIVYMCRSVPHGYPLCHHTEDEAITFDEVHKPFGSRYMVYENQVQRIH